MRQPRYVFFYGEPCTQLAAVPFCIAVCIPVRVGLLNVPCYASLGTILSTLCVHHIYRAGSIDSVGRSRSPKNA